MNGHGTHGSSPQASGHSGHEAAQAAGVSLDAGGFTLGAVSAPAAVGEPGELSFRILDDGGAAVTAYAPQHEKDLHLIVVRSDGARFRHVHPVLDTATGIWSLPWTWDAAGSYRVFADFAALRQAQGPDAAPVPGVDPGPGAAPVTLTRTVDVAGSFTPIASVATAETTVDGFGARIDGDLVPGSASELIVTITRDGTPVTALQPYLGAYGHLVALREGDLAYLHVHPEGAAPMPGELSGPEVRFAAHVPTAGRYLLYFDFQVDGAVHTAAFVLDATTRTH